MTIQTFIEDMIDGGWKNDFLRANPHAEVAVLIADGVFERDIYRILLDPLAWKAVGKVEGWDSWGKDEQGLYDRQPKHIYLMHRMIDALEYGRTIEEFIATL